MNIYKLRETTKINLIDYNQLIDQLKNYAHPRGKISKWLASGDLIRVKKGLYVFGRHISKTPYPLEVIANLIYGPSMISLEYALSFYGLIPESVHTVTSITSKRNKVYDTPIGRFSYRYLSTKKYSIGSNLVGINKDGHFLIASPEKALCDKIYFMDKVHSVSSSKDVEKLLFDDLRLDEDGFRKMNTDRMNHLVKNYGHKNLKQVISVLEKYKKASS